MKITIESAPVIFLDIDGVLNGHRSFGNGYCGIECENVDRFNRILAAHQSVKIVICSAWRYMFHGGEVTRRGFEYMLLTHGVDARERIAGFTETDEATVDWLNAPLRTKDGKRGEDIRRFQIQRFVESESIKHFLVIDDLNLSMPEQIQTNGAAGLSDADVDAVLNRLLSFHDQSK